MADCVRTTWLLKRWWLCELVNVLHIRMFLVIQHLVLRVPKLVHRRVINLPSREHGVSWVRVSQTGYLLHASVINRRHIKKIVVVGFIFVLNIVEAE